jgi:ClpX C4-type zinc finger
MVAFEISVNGQRRFVGDDVTAITLAADWVARRKADRVSLHVGVGEPGERQVQYLGADLGPGDEIAIRVLTEEEGEAAESGAPESCSFCGSSMHDIRSLVSGPQVAICDTCLSSFDAFVAHGVPLPVGASIREQGDVRCGFCQKGPPQIAGLLFRNAAAICPECLRACVDMTRGTKE